MNPLPHWIELLGLTGPWTYGLLFLAASLLLVWRLEALLDHGLEGTALATMVMPYCSGLGNLLFVWIIARQGGPASEIAVNAVVNNVTNLTLLLGLPALVWGLQLAPPSVTASGKARGKKKNAADDADLPRRLNKLALLLTLTGALFFTGAVWALGRDGDIDFGDGLVLVGLFGFWQTVQAYDVLKHNARQRIAFGPLFYIDLALVLLSAWGLFTGIDWIVGWLGTLEGGGVFSADNLGWLTGWLMVIPNALIAFYYAHRRRAEVVYASQVGDGHICIPLMIGIYALWQPVPVSATMLQGLLLIAGATIVHLGCVLTLGGLPRWLGAALIAAYGWFVWTGLIA